MHTEALQYSVSATLLSPTQRLFRSLDANADGQITRYEIRTSGVMLPKDTVAAASDTAQSGGSSEQNSFSNSASRFQYFLAMMTQSTDKPVSAPKPAPKPAEANPYQSVADNTAQTVGASTVV